MRKVWINSFEFFKSILLINLAVCLVSSLFGGIDSFFFIFVSFGFGMSVLYKEVYRKNDYLFYANNGISKVKLITLSYLYTLGLCVLGMFLFYK